MFGHTLSAFQGDMLPGCRSGQVTQKMLDAPDKRLFLGIGGLEAASQLLGFVGASKLPGHCNHPPQPRESYATWHHEAGHTIWREHYCMQR